MSESCLPLEREFPKLKDRIEHLRSTHAQFRSMHDKYQSLNAAIEKREQRVELDSELNEEKLRKERLKLKDQLYYLLNRENP